MIKYKYTNFKRDRMVNTCREVLTVKMDLGRLTIYILLVCPDVKDKKEISICIYENFDLTIREIDNQMLTHLKLIKV